MNVNTHKQSCREKYSSIATRLAFYILLAMASDFVAANTSRVTVFFYNSETNVNNFATLKRSFDSYLGKEGNFNFQPFREKAVFERVGLNNTNGAYLMSSWHYSTMSKQQKSKITPILVASYKGKNTYRKVVSIEHAIESLESLKGIRLASAGSVEHTRDLLLQMFGKKLRHIVKSIKILSVPKDIDALMSVSFGMAQAALTAERSLRKLKLINSKQRKLLHIIATSKEILMPILAVPKNGKDWTNTLVEIFTNMGGNLEGRQKLMIIGQDGWRTLDSKMLGMLEK